MKKNLNLTPEQTTKLITEYDDFMRQIETLKEIEEPKTSETEETTDNETKELLVAEQFDHLTRTLYKSLLKAIGIEETLRISLVISNNNMVFFNYNGVQYKYNPRQCKVYKKDGIKYQRINWKDFTDDKSPTDQKQANERPPP